MTLKVTYRYSSLEFEGKHELPILLRVFQGKQFWIKCIGRTLGKATPCIVPRTKSGLTELFPVALGTRTHEAPLQLTELMNVSAVPVTYKIDMGAISRFNETQGFGLTLLQLENPSGTIDRYKSIMLRWRFMPLEVKDYILHVGLKLTCGKDSWKETLKLKSCGYDPRDWNQDPHR